MTDRKYIDPRSQSADRLAEIYEKLSATGATVTPEDDGDDPLTRLEKADRWVRAKEVSQRVTKFLMLCAEEYGLGPEDILYATELNALNVFNAEDMPLTAEKAAAARQAAYEYYAASLAALPPAPKKR